MCPQDAGARLGRHTDVPSEPVRPADERSEGTAKRREDRQPGPTPVRAATQAPDNVKQPPPVHAVTQAPDDTKQPLPVHAATIRHKPASPTHPNNPVGIMQRVIRTF
ncbi:hypothetical protein CQW29_18065 [Pantoea coffeiphila]|uniref:Uncharacterized protein n=1 Tax=Pantoea coffeiphila TaxID=1465635 RepID=A0A2S9I8Y8_9GAMM|nr:hypothetical protein CQW29_18065 [Pantoea coffeiphila]